MPKSTTYMSISLSFEKSLNDLFLTYVQVLSFLVIMIISQFQRLEIGAMGEIGRR